jgi:hypothetical protein
MRKPKEKAVKKQSPSVQTAAIATEQYKRTGSGFVLVKTARNGSVTEIPLSNFSAEIVAEKWREGTAGCVDWVLVRVQFEGKTKDIQLSARDSYVPPYQRSFDDRLIAALREVHPRIIIYPGKTNQVLTAIKTLSEPRVIESDNNKNNKQTNKE